MIALRDVALRQGSELLLEAVNLTFHPGTRTGITGANGCGKSTLLSAIMGKLDTDKGSIDTPADWQFGWSAQEAPAVADSALDYVLAGDTAVAAVLAALAQAEAADDALAIARAHQKMEALHAYDAHARAGRLLHGLGFAADTHTQSVAEFSGGWRVRLSLARVLMMPSDALLLDEPTNHLDLDAVLWLERWLKHYQGTLLVISHDREFLDAVCTQIVYLHHGRAQLFSGNYSAFERQYAEQQRQQQLNQAKEQAERERLQSFVRRFQAKASKARQAQARIKRLQKMAQTQVVPVDRAFAFQFEAPARIPQSMLKLSDASMGYSPNATVLRNVNLTLEAGDRIGLLGANGAGKSTLVKALVGELALQHGERRAHKDLGIGYFAQHTVENLRAGTSPDQHLVQVAPQATTQERRDWLGRWGFPGDKALADVDQFSGGERARLALSLIAWQAPNLLVLDEPTNHLDIGMREALTEALNSYQGALILVAHDRYLLSLVCDDFWHVANGTLTHFAGDLDDYAKSLHDASKTHTKARAKPKQDRQAERRQAALQRQQTQGLRKQLQRIEKRMAQTRQQLDAMAQQLADPHIYTDDKERAVALGREQGQLRTTLATLEDEWLDISQQVEEALHA